MGNFNTLAKELIQKKINAERRVAMAQLNLDRREKQVNTQHERAMNGLDNEFAFQKAFLAKDELILREANDELFEINTEIETYKLSAEINSLNLINKSEEVDLMVKFPFGKVAEYDVNYWDKDCFGLFNYLSENYNATAPKQKFINIWFYLEYYTPNSYVFNCPKDKYRPYIFERFSIEIKKMNRPPNYDNQLIILNNHFTNYCNTLNEMK